MAEDQQVLKVVMAAGDAVLSLQVVGSDADVGYADSVDWGSLNVLVGDSLQEQYPLPLIVDTVPTQQ